MASSVHRALEVLPEHERPMIELAYWGGLSQSEIAGLAGTSRATVNRVLRAEENRGTVQVQRGTTTLLDRAALAKRGGAGPRS
jgi:DNA-directed RNA polymerase specialized sigma24 family protein